MSTDGEFSADEDELLERLLAGDLDEGAGEVHAAFAADPSLREHYDALVEIQRGLDAGAIQEAVLEEARTGSWPEGEARLEETLRREAPVSLRRPLAGRRPLVSHRRFALVAAAAALFATILIYGGFSTDEPPMLLGQVPPGASPIGDVEVYPPFRWDLELESPAWRFEFVVYDATEAAGLKRIVGPLHLDQSEWQPKQDESLDWPSEILWTVGLVSAGGQVQEPYTVRARLSP